MCVWVCKRDRDGLCVCMCVREIEMVCVCVCERERVCVCVCELFCLGFIVVYSIKKRIRRETREDEV